MTEEIFRRDSYAFEFEAKVLSADGDEIELDITAFYPGGGGQVCDTGKIRGSDVTEVFLNKNRIIHRVPGNDLNHGDTVWCSVDWDRRYDLMMGHTGEHLLFCSLRRQVPDLSVNKIYISPKSKCVVVDRDISWDDIREAAVFANRAIRDNLPVTKTVMSRDDPEMCRVRIKKERIPEGEDVSVVSIGDIDLSACSGLHVMETGELEMIFVDRKVSAGKDGTAVHFKVGNEAKDAAAYLANTCLQASDAAESKPEDLMRAVSNLRAETETLRKTAGLFARERLMSLVPAAVGDAEIVGGVFPSVDLPILSEAAEYHKNSGRICILVSVGDGTSAVMSSGFGGIDCKAILSGVLAEFGGRGGGKQDFAQGGVSDPSVSGKLFSKLTEETAARLH
ncbi:MAG: alanyl-tRNA editing protein [Candidatus Methanoplasma sp.]|jgi:alanyl-tRNA synthetase|nr:alanyl-tRNA editing protein [Candidatus Methanoplasma sp.]